MTLRVAPCFYFFSAPVFDFEAVLLVDSVHVHDGTGLEDGVELHGHAEATKHHVGVAVLAAKRLVGDFETRGAVDRAVDPRHLPTGRSFCIQPLDHFVILKKTLDVAMLLFLPRCGYGPLARLQK